MNTKLWQPIQVGNIKLNHRLAMAPMTRGRSAAHGVPTGLSAEYYAQRASMALIISEGTQPSDDGRGYLFTPGIYTDDQVIGWRKVTEAVRSAGGQMFIQLMHVGRIAHPANTPHGRQAVAPSAVKPNAKMFTPSGLQDIPEPRTLRADEIPAVIQEFRRAAAAARRAGAEGVEIHGASGYLIHQFLSDNSNLRTDQYGGSIERKIRFAVEVASAVADEIGAGRTVEESWLSQRPLDTRSGNKPFLSEKGLLAPATANHRNVSLNGATIHRQQTLNRRDQSA